MPRLGDVVKVLRSKNAGAFAITLDIFFHDRESYEAFKRLGILVPERLASLYSIRPDQVLSIHWFDQVSAVKATIERRVSCGEPGDTDTLGAQQYPPLYYLEVPEEIVSRRQPT